MRIPFNRPYFTGDEINTMIKAAMAGQISGNGEYTKKCHKLFEKKFGFAKVLLTNSCTDALEMAAVLCNFKEGDEVIMPSYTFVSMASAFVLHGAKVVFADSRHDNPNIDETKIEELITDKTRAIVVVHYNGIACEMDSIMEIARKHNLFIIEDAAHSMDSYYKKKPLGSIGDFSSFSFHETKNIITGEGGLLAINNKDYIERAEIIWEKGTNRAAFKRGDVKKYEWVDVGASYLPSEIMAATLFAQMSQLKNIQDKRVEIWHTYYNKLKELEKEGFLQLPILPEYATVNGSMFYFICHNGKERNKLLKYLNKNNIYAVFHYLPLHTSPYYHDKHDGRSLPNTDRYADCIIRLPFYYELGDREIEEVVDRVKMFYRK